MDIAEILPHAVIGRQKSPAVHPQVAVSRGLHSAYTIADIV